MPALRRIIPARAGSRIRRRASLRFVGDHPRACGEQAIRELNWSNEKGSSPRVRGADNLVRRIVEPLGIIPARAGSRPTPTLADR